MALREAFPIEVPRDKIKFFEEVLGFNKPDFHLFDYQKEFLLDPELMKVLRFCRRGTKTTLLSGDDIYDCVVNPKFTVIVTMPKFQQIKEVYFQSEAGLQGHIDRMPDKYRNALILENLKTSLTFTNGSKILAEVPEPDTIRGHGPNKIVADEFNFIRKDRELWLSALMPMGLTKRIKINIASTPWNKDSVYYEMCFDKAFSMFSGNVWHGLPADADVEGKAKYLKIFSDVTAPNGPLLPDQVEVMRKQYISDPWRWKREMECAFVDDETAFLPAALIVKCQNENVEYAAFEELVNGDLFAGWDLGRDRDPSAIAVLNKIGDYVRLVHVKQFGIGTPYTTQMQYIQSLCLRWRNVISLAYDHTGTKGMDEEIATYNFPRVIPVDFSVSSKHGMAMTLKQLMMTVRSSDVNKDVTDARRRFELPYSAEIFEELNVEQWEQKSGSELYSFSHPQGTHDEVFWAIALATYASQKFSSGLGGTVGAKMLRYRKKLFKVI